jgi:hypothetical protein
MNDWLNTLLHSDYGQATNGGPAGTMFIMLLAFMIGHFVGFVYMWTHHGISYSRTFVASLAVLPVIIAIMMIVMAGNALIAFGLLAVFGVIRFRNVLKDTRDTTFVMWSIMEGLTVGTMRYTTALMAAVCIAMVMLYLRLTEFGTRHRFDAVLTLRLSGDLDRARTDLRRTLDRHTLQATLAAERRVVDEGVDMTYHLLLRDPARFEELQSELSPLDGFGNVAVFMHDDEAEI